MSEVLTKLSREHHPRISNENTKDLGQHIFSERALNTGSLNPVRYWLKCYALLPTTPEMKPSTVAERPKN